MAIKELCFGIIAFSITAFIIGEVYAQPESIQNSTGLNERKAVFHGGLESNGSLSHPSVGNADNIEQAVIFQIP
jgi:hypothetical protein